jgi:hypothetical protein
VPGQKATRSELIQLGPNEPQIAHIPLDFPRTASMCGAEKEPPMDAISLDTTVKTSLALVRAKLEKGLRIATAAEVCSISGRTGKAFEVALGLEEIVSDVSTLLNTNRLAAAFGARLSCRRGAQALQAEARIQEGRSRAGLPDHWRKEG